MRLKNQGSHSIHYVSHQENQGARKKFVKKHDKGKTPLKINEDSLQIQKKVSKSNNFHFVGNLDTSRRIAQSVSLGSKRKVSLMLLYILNQT